MHNIIIIFLQTNKELLLPNYFNFLNNVDFRCQIYLKNMNKAVIFNNQKLEINYYDDNLHFDFENIRNIISEYEYFIYLDDNTKYVNMNLSNLIDKSFEIFDTNTDINQIIFTENNRSDHDYNNISNYEIFNRITQSNKIFINNKNPYIKVNYNKINYRNLINCNSNKTDNLNIHFSKYNFQLVASIINTNLFLLDNIKLFTYNLHFIDNNDNNENNTNTNIPIVTNKIMLNSNKTNNNKINNNDDITIITAFLDLKIKRPAKRVTQEYDYIEKAKGTLSLKHNMVIYVSENLIKYVKEFRKNIGLEEKTKIIEISIENNLYMYNQLDKIKENVKKNISPYDIAEYVLSVNSRYGYMKDAIENNYFSSNFYAWVDFSAGHIVHIPEKFKITYSGIEKIRIAWISRLNKAKDDFVFNHYCLGGGIFMGHKDIMLELIKIHDIEFRKLADLGYCINDDKLLFTIFEKYPYLFDTYHCGYKSLLSYINN